SLVLGGVAALAIMSHTLGGILITAFGIPIGVYAYFRRKPGVSKVASLLCISFGFIFLAILRYVVNYLDTGNPMGYGLYYDIYKNTWAEQYLAPRWEENSRGLFEIIVFLFERYGLWIQASAIVVGLTAIIFCRRRRGAIIYDAIFISYTLPLIIIASGIFIHVGINLRTAMTVNVRYPLAHFIFCAPLLMVGIYRISTVLFRNEKKPKIIMFLI